MLYSQLQEGLLLSLVRRPAGSGCQTYRELCTAAKPEEKLADLKQRRQYQQQGSKGNQLKQPEFKKRQQPERGKVPSNSRPQEGSKRPGAPRTCYTCGSPDHMARECKARSKESRGNSSQEKGGGKVQTESTESATQREDPASYLYSSSESEEES